jgi:hypothetical protein
MGTKPFTEPKLPTTAGSEFSSLTKDVAFGEKPCLWRESLRRLLLRICRASVGLIGKGKLKERLAAQFGDITLRRQFCFTGKLGLQSRAEFFNILNHPNFGSPPVPK